LCAEGIFLKINVAEVISNACTEYLMMTASGKASVQIIPRLFPEVFSYLVF